MATLLQISDRVRIESHPRRFTKKATEQLLADNVTAAHYKACRPATEQEIASPTIETRDGQRIFRDALGAPIEIGKPMAYIDWLAPEDAHVYTVYRLEPVLADEANPAAGTVDRYLPHGTFDTLQEAEAAAEALGD
jgi:hypothetical protein